VKVLFLDIDGVLNNAQWMVEVKKVDREKKVSLGDGDGWWLDMIEPRAVSLLNEVIQQTDAKVVISSTWRLRHSPEKMQELLEARGFKGEVIGKTPRFGGERRGKEIQAWLDANPEVRVFAIVDDDSDMLHLAEYLIHTSWQTGLQPPHVEALVAALGS
jgi:hypothetical protein